MVTSEDSNIPSGDETDQQSDTCSELNTLSPLPQHQQDEEDEPSSSSSKAVPPSARTKNDDHAVSSTRATDEGTMEATKATTTTTDTPTAAAPTSSSSFVSSVPRGTSVPNGTEKTNAELVEVVQRTISFSDERVVEGEVQNGNGNNSCPHRAEPEGAAANRASRRFDDEMMKAVMSKEEEEEKKATDAPSSSYTNKIEQPEPQRSTPEDEHEDISKESSSSSLNSPPKLPRETTVLFEESKIPMSQLQLQEEKTFEEERLSRLEPPGTPAESSSKEIRTELTTEQQREMSAPILPSSNDTEPNISPMQSVGSPHEHASYHENASYHSVQQQQNQQQRASGTAEAIDMPRDDQSNFHGESVSHPQSFTMQVPGNMLHAVPIPAPMAGHMEFESAARSSFTQAPSSVIRSSGISYQSTTEMGIPHLPPLVVPGSSHHHHHVPIPAPVHANGYHALATRLTPASSQALVPGGKRRIHLRLEEDVAKAHQRGWSFSKSLSFRRNGSILRKNPLHSPINEAGPTPNPQHWVERGSLTVSWYEGTSTLELQEHVRNSVMRKLRFPATTKLADFRVLDDSMNPPEEIVLCPYIPNESRLLLRFTTKDAGGEATPNHARPSDYSNGPPESPSAAPSPHPSVDLGGLGLNANQLALLGARLRGLQMSSPDQIDGAGRIKLVDEKKPLPRMPSFRTEGNNTEKTSKEDSPEKSSPDDDDENSKGSTTEIASLHPEDQIQKSLREITEILIAERSGKRYNAPRQEKRQVIFVLANYFVLFLSLIAISAEIQARAPEWHAAMERHLKNVQNCSKDKESLFDCVENGDFAGLIASVLLWISRSAATRRIFLFGFESPKRLWTVVYESLVTAVCWGFSYMFIRRGMNPDTSRNFLQKYWKDAVYGSLAGFNAAFMKQVLKNLIPEEAIEDAFQDRQLKILSWLPSFS